MFFEISKLLNLFISPITWIILLLLGTFLFKKKKLRKTCLVCSIAVFVVFTNHLLVDYVKYQTVKKYNAIQINPKKKYQVAIVMGGFASMNTVTGMMQYQQNRADRLWEAVRLWKSDVVDFILITGDPTSFIDEDGTTTAPLFLNYMGGMGVPRDVFILEQRAKNTHENAEYSVAILQNLNVKDTQCLLITSATHMERSLKCFASVEWHPDFYPVNTYAKLNKVNHRAFYPSWEAAVKWQELFNEWIGNCIYQLMGYA